MTSGLARRDDTRRDGHQTDHLAAVILQQLYDALQGKIRSSPATLEAMTRVCNPTVVFQHLFRNTNSQAGYSRFDQEQLPYLFSGHITEVWD